jgi:hypothetical protein
MGGLAVARWPPGPRKSNWLACNGGWAVSDPRRADRLQEGRLRAKVMDAGHPFPSGMCDARESASAMLMFSERSANEID